MNKVIGKSLKLGLLIALTGVIIAGASHVIASMHYSDFALNSSQESRAMANQIAKTALYSTSIISIAFGGLLASVYFLAANNELKRKNRVLLRSSGEYSFDASQYKYDKHPEI